VSACLISSIKKEKCYGRYEVSAYALVHAKLLPVTVQVSGYKFCELKQLIQSFEDFFNIKSTPLIFLYIKK